MRSYEITLRLDHNEVLSYLPQYEDEGWDQLVPGVRQLVIEQALRDFGHANPVVVKIHG